MKTGLYVGRFQPLHKGHMQAIDDALKEVDHLIIGVGSSEQHHRYENPFTFEERKTMIERVARGSYSVVAIPDVNNEDIWVDHVKGIVGDFQTIYTGNAIVSELFRKRGHEVKTLEKTLYISASGIRQRIANEDEDWKDLVPDAVADYIIKIDGHERVRKLKRNYLNPVVAVDMIIRYKGGIVIIQRQDGRLAFPGGFVEYGERTEDAAVREAKEETGLDITLNGLIGVYSDPKRDSRMHVIGIPYAAEGTGELKPGDDAKQAIVMPIEDVRKIKLGFDHNQMLEDYLKTCQKTG